MTTDLLHQLPAETWALLRRHGLHRKLLYALVVEQAVSRVALRDEAVAKVFEVFCKKQGLEEPDALQARLLELNLAEADLRWQLELPLRVARHAHQEFGPKAEARFLERKESLDQVVYSLLRTKDAGLARELYLQIAGGEANFADLAAEYAEGPERGTRGIVGPVPLTQAHPALAERLRTGTPGGLMEPFAVNEWWLVARLERLEPARFTKKMANVMARELFEEWAREEVSRIMLSLPSALNPSPLA